MAIQRKENCVIDSYQESVLSMIEAMFPSVNLLVSRGHDTPLGQLHHIGFYARNFKLPEFDPQDLESMVEVDYEGKTVKAYKWWRTWGMCLNKGIIINPPVAAMTPYDYVKNGVNKKGKTIPASAHCLPADADPMVTPCPIDFSQKIDGKPDINRVAACLNQAKASGVPIKKITVEHGNGCCHIDLLPKKKEG